MNTLIQRDALTHQFHDIRTQTVNLCTPLKPEDFSAQPADYVSPPKWHLGHTTWFFETFLLKPYKKGYTPFGKDYDFIFNSYYESVGKRAEKSNRGSFTRPTIEEVLAYRAHVDNAMKELLALGEQLPIKAQEILAVGLNHEQQHQELLVYDIKYILGTNPLFPAYLDQKHPQNGIDTVSSKSNTNYITIEEGIYEVGHSGKGFCFDNELGRHKVYLQAFQVQDRLTTNGEYLAFMEADGYNHFRYWLSEGWQWVQENGINSPLYWHYIDQAWHHYTLYGLEKINLDDPVTHISFYEAEAFAQWKGQRLLTEFEWEAACNRLVPSYVQAESNLLEEGLLSPIKKPEGNFQFYGDCWEWTSSAYRPYPYFKTAQGALGEYNGKFMINQMVLRGGSCATPRNHIRSSYRNFYHPHMRWPISGIRLAKDL